MQGFGPMLTYRGTIRSYNDLREFVHDAEVVS